jgi:hypothetical protein
MAGFTRINGDLQPVAVYDSATYTNFSANTANTLIAANGVTVQPQGPKLNFFTVTSAELEPATSNVATVLNIVVQSIQQLSTIYMYEFTDVGSNGNLALAIYPTAGQTAASLQTEIRALGSNVAGLGVDLSAAVVANGATFTSVA